MKSWTGAALALVAAGVMACGAEGSENPADVASLDAAVGPVLAEVSATTDEQSALAEAALTNAGTIDAEAAKAEPAQRSSSKAPSYDSRDYCRKIGKTVGGSSVIEGSCRDMEEEALTAIKSRDIPARVHAYCTKIGQTAGGSYVIYNSCVDMELEAASEL